MEWDNDASIPEWMCLDPVSSDPELEEAIKTFDVPIPEWLSPNAPAADVEESSDLEVQDKERPVDLDLENVELVDPELKEGKEEKKEEKEKNEKIQLPILMYCVVNHPNLPEKKLNAVLMKLGYPRKPVQPRDPKKRGQPRQRDSSVFMIPPGTPVPTCTGLELMDWAFQHCPVKLRFASISYCLTYHIKFPTSPYYNGVKRYPLWKKQWRIPILGGKPIGEVLSLLVENPYYDFRATPHSPIPNRRASQRVEGATTPRCSEMVVSSGRVAKRKVGPTRDDSDGVPRKKCGPDLSSSVPVQTEESAHREWCAPQPQVPCLLPEGAPRTVGHPAKDEDQLRQVAVPAISPDVGRALSDKGVAGEWQPDR